ncbi:hypothetical protein C7C45_01120 [Micromonospora arborensis]|uniref:Uncharacterized protein n=1 Tax=Micromonospora arborensis TaxID=2116518 RepID=A0A318NQI3_9ACTN|nr:hypothetical protein C7C45_01120 [Micromonospora arborensis]
MIEEGAGWAGVSRETGAGAVVTLVGAAGPRTPGGVARGVAGGCGGAHGELVAGGPPAEGRIAARVAMDRVGPDRADRVADSVAVAAWPGPGVGGGACCSFGAGADGPR